MFPADAPRLEGLLWLPDAESPAPSGPSAGVVVCHPHPLYGGDMHNSVVRAVARALCARSIAALRFNFRGVGRSSGAFDDGVGEQDDVRDALSALAFTPGIGAERLGLTGYSFGARVALGAAEKDDRVRALAAISPAGGLPTNFRGPRLFIAGDNDEFVSAEWLVEEVAKLTEPKELEIIAGADHFWFGYEEEMAERVADFFEMLNDE
ncbi:MAG: alpha/beta fold hydrolase [Chloroflexi bacterium]|nr:alpha/beta fold hydrolase [Chloroflexota bacterium]